jgi:carbon storage regulator CsrA
MLVLSRKIGEKLIVGDNITVVVSRISGNRVTIGIEAPPEVRIVRGELSDHPAATQEPAAVLASGFRQEADTASASVPRLAK